MTTKKSLIAWLGTFGTIRPITAIIQIPFLLLPLILLIVTGQWRLRLILVLPLELTRPHRHRRRTRAILGIGRDHRRAQYVINRELDAAAGGLCRSGTIPDVTGGYDGGRDGQCWRAVLRAWRRCLGIALCNKWKVIIIK